MNVSIKMPRGELPALLPYQSIAVETVICVINKALAKVGVRLNLSELAESAQYAFARNKVPLRSVEPPIGITAGKFIAKTIERDWRLTEVFKYHLQYMGNSKDEISQYYYFEVIFSQPTAEFPIPQATVTVYFRVEEKLIEINRGTPLIHFTIEGHHTDHDVRYVSLTPDWLLAVLQMKLQFFKQIEELGFF